jgi:hypothetical protein
MMQKSPLLCVFFCFASKIALFNKFRRTGDRLLQLGMGVYGENRAKKNKIFLWKQFTLIHQHQIVVFFFFFIYLWGADCRSKDYLLQTTLSKLESIEYTGCINTGSEEKTHVGLL